MLPIDVKAASSINDFKVKSEYYKHDSIRKGNINRYWDFLQDIFRRG